MTTAAGVRPPVSRPGSSVAIDPRRLMAMRYRRTLKRWQVSERIAALGLTSDRGDPVTMGRDMLGKCETGIRSPSLDTLRALCIVLECTADDLMPGGPVITMPPTARARQSRLAHNRELRDFAIRHGLRYKNPGTGRVYYSRKLREAYAAEVARVLAEGTGDPGKIEQAREAATAALRAASSLRAPASRRRDEEPQDEHEEPLAS